MRDNATEEKPEQFGLPHNYRPYKCTVCGHEQEIQTNHTSSCLDVCKGCSWTPYKGEGFKIPSLGGSTYRKFIFIYLE